MPTAQRIYSRVVRTLDRRRRARRACWSRCSAQRVQAVLPSGLRGDHRVSADPAGHGPVQLDRRDPARRPAGVRGHLAVCRCVHHLQQLLDHDRPAHAPGWACCGPSGPRAASIVREVVLEALIIGVVASAIGVGFGVLVATPARRLLRRLRLEPAQSAHPGAGAHRHHRDGGRDRRHPDRGAAARRSGPAGSRRSPRCGKSRPPARTSARRVVLALVVTAPGRRARAGRACSRARATPTRCSASGPCCCSSGRRC